MPGVPFGRAEGGKSVEGVWVPPFGLLGTGCGVEVGVDGGVTVPGLAKGSVASIGVLSGVFLGSGREGGTYPPSSCGGLSGVFLGGGGGLSSGPVPGGVLSGVLRGGGDGDRGGVTDPPVPAPGSSLSAPKAGPPGSLKVGESGTGSVTAGPEGPPMPGLKMGLPLRGQGPPGVIVPVLFPVAGPRMGGTVAGLRVRGGGTDPGPAAGGLSCGSRGLRPK
jgi:hypothetical protein